MRTRNDFADFFTNNLLNDDALTDLERRRIRQKRRKFNSALTLVLLVLVNAAALIVMRFSLYWLILSVPVLAFIVVWIFQNVLHDKELNSDFKNFVIKRMMDFIAPDFEYHHDKFVSYKLYEQSKLYKTKPDHYHGDDMFMGIVRGVPVQFCELKSAFVIEKRESNRTIKKLAPIFHGLFLVAITKKNFNTNIFIFSDNLQKTFNALGKGVQEFNFGKSHFVDLPYPEINQEFAIYADNPDEASLSLSYEFLNLILEFKQNTGMDFRLSFIGNKMFLAMPFEREMFEIDVQKSLFDIETLLPYFDDLNFGISIVDIMHLDKPKEVKIANPFPPEFYD
jgi:hypothetical protein